MEAVVGIIDALAWPVCVLWLTYLFRSEIQAVASRVSHLKFKEFEAKFSQELNAVEVSLKELEQAKPNFSPSNASTSNPQLDQLERIAEVSPRAAIIEAWRLIEDAASRSGFVQGASIPRINAALFVNWFVREGKLPVDSEATFDALRDLRNKAAHAPEFSISSADAQRYLRLAARASQLIDNA
ncbi:hypothetical protein D3C81_825100 [compost metagenome]